MEESHAAVAGETDQPSRILGGCCKKSTSNKIVVDLVIKCDMIQSSTQQLERNMNKAKMIELLEQIVQYLTTHVHPFFGMPPVPAPPLEDILKNLADAPNTILNQNIRIN
jgi:hypothetical protein